MRTFHLMGPERREATGAEITQLFEEAVMNGLCPSLRGMAAPERMAKALHDAGLITLAEGSERWADHVDAAAYHALLVITMTADTRDWLEQNDPQALKQAYAALKLLASRLPAHLHPSEWILRAR